MLLSSSPVPWCNTGAAGTKSIYRKSQKTHEWTRRHTTDNNVLLWSYRCLIKSIISCLVFLLSSPVIDVCVLKLTGLQRCCIHLHTICQQQQQQQQTTEFQQHHIYKIVPNQQFYSHFYGNMNKIWTSWWSFIQISDGVTYYIFFLFLFF